MTYSGPEDQFADEAEEELGEAISSDEKSENGEKDDNHDKSKKKKDDKIKIKKIVTQPRPKLDVIRYNFKKYKNKNFSFNFFFKEFVEIVVCAW